MICKLKNWKTGWGLCKTEWIGLRNHDLPKRFSLLFIGAHSTWVSVPVLPLACCGVLGRLPCPPRPSLSLQQNGWIREILARFWTAWNVYVEDPRKVARISNINGLDKEWKIKKPWACVLTLILLPLHWVHRTSKLMCWNYIYQKLAFFWGGETYCVCREVKWNSRIFFTRCLLVPLSEKSWKPDTLFTIWLLLFLWWVRNLEQLLGFHSGSLKGRAKRLSNNFFLLKSSCPPRSRTHPHLKQIFPATADGVYFES